jgi:Fe-S cluster assembly protein SufD
VDSAFALSQIESHAALAPGLSGARHRWLSELRAEALAGFRAQGLPNARDERWKYSSLRNLAQAARAIGDTGAQGRVVPADLLDSLPGAGARLVFVNGVFRSDLSDLHAAEGLTLAPLGAVLEGPGSGLEFFLSRHFREPHQGFARLNTAYAAEGAVIRVEPGARIARPVHLVFVGAAADADVAWYARNLVEVGEDASLAVIEHYLGAGAHGQFGNVVTQASTKRGARLGWLRVQDEDERAALIARSEFQLAEGATLTLHQLELGAAFARHDLSIDLAGVGSAATTRGLYALHGRQHGDTQIEVSHAARDTSSDVLWRGVADGRARAVFNGAITVQAGADGSDARLSNKNLLLSPHAEIDTKPVLEIHADEVKASHGATVGQLDEQALFYLRSRGVPLEAARSMLTYGFCRSVLDGVEPDDWREHLAARLAAHLPEGGEG